MNNRLARKLARLARKLADALNGETIADSLTACALLISYCLHKSEPERRAGLLKTITEFLKKEIEHADRKEAASRGDDAGAA